jgi:hypothetical protein
MKYCYQCGHMTQGDPAYCGTCGRTYDVRLCPRHHQNPRGAEVCSQCGSKELSTPQPKIPMIWRLLALLTRLVLGLLLFYTTLRVLEALLVTPAFQQMLVVFGGILCALWWLWSKLPDWLQEVLRSLWKARNHDE